MKKCNSCNIEFNTNDKYCPLCQNILIGETKEVMFPKNIRLKTNSLILKIVLFISIIILLLSGFIELLMSPTIKYSIYVGLGLITNYVIMYFSLNNYQNIYRIIGKYGFILIILLLIWYIVTKSKIITNYIIPSVCITELIFSSVAGIILRKNYIIKYSDQIIMNIFLLLLPIVLVSLNQTTNNIMSYICYLFSIISISGILIFFYDDIKEEIYKIFNI